MSTSLPTGPVIPALLTSPVTVPSSAAAANSASTSAASAVSSATVTQRAPGRPDLLGHRRRALGLGAIAEHDVVAVGGEPAADRGADAAAAAGDHGQRARHYSAAASSSRTEPGARPVSRSTTSVWALSAPMRVAAPNVA